MEKLVFVCLFLCLLLSCSQNKSGEELIVLSPHSPEIRYEFGRGFSQWYAARTGRQISVTWLDVGGTGESIEYIRSRNARANQAGGVDVFFGGGDYPFIRLAAQNLLAAHPLPPTAQAAIPAWVGGVPVYAADSLWYGAALSGFGIMYNKEALRREGLPVPRTFVDLIQPAFAGLISSADPRYSGSVHMMYEIMLQAYGWERGWNIISRLGANIQSFTKGASSSAKDVAMGQAVAGLAIDFYAFIEIQRYGSHRLGFVFPQGESVVTPDGIAVLSNASHPSAAHDFVDYVLTDGQKLWIYAPGVPGGPQRYALCRLPVDTTLLRTDPALLAIDTASLFLPQTIAYDSRIGGKRWSVLNDMFAAVIMTPHKHLVRAGRHIEENNVSDTTSARAFRLGLTQEEALALTAQWDSKGHAARRIEYMNKWTLMAIHRYTTLIHQ